MVLLAKQKAKVPKWERPGTREGSIMSDETELRKQVKAVKVLHADYKIAQAESNTALARYKRAIAELEAMWLCGKIPGKLPMKTHEKTLVKSSMSHTGQ